MEFLQPGMLWGMLAVAVPVAIHFWYQKKGQVLDWAASRWLIDETSLKHRGIRLHEIPLLLLRCLLLLLLALLLSQPVADWWNDGAAPKTVHIVQPEATVVANYRFELENALKAGEKIVWLSPAGQEAKTLTEIPTVANSVNYLQETINQAASGGHLKMYLNRSSLASDQPEIYVPGAFTLFTTEGPASTDPIPFMALKSNQKLFVEPETGILTTGQSRLSAGRFNSAPVHSGDIRVLLDFKNQYESQAATAALEALSEVYGIGFNLSQKDTSGAQYDWVLADHAPEAVKPGVLYLVTGNAAPVRHADQVHYLADSLRLSTSPWVQTGRLPEWLGEVLLAHFHLNKKTGLSDRQTRARFVRVEQSTGAEAVKIRRWLLLLLVLTTLAERWIALRKNNISGKWINLES